MNTEIFTVYLCHVYKFKSMKAPSCLVESYDCLNGVLIYFIKVQSHHLSESFHTS